VRLVDLCHKFQLIDALADGDAELMGVDDAGERAAGELPFGGLERRSRCRG
jgi:hypothetical protein